MAPGPLGPGKASSNTRRTTGKEENKQPIFHLFKGTDFCTDARLDAKDTLVLDAVGQRLYDSFIAAIGKSELLLPSTLHELLESRPS